MKKIKSEMMTYNEDIFSSSSIYSSKKTFLQNLVNNNTTFHNYSKL